MSIMSIKLTTLLPFATAFLVATLLGLLFLHPQFFGQNDLIGIWSAQHLFLTGGNPYSQEELLATQLAENPQLPAILPIWNPPLLFVTLGAFASFTPQETVLAITLLRAVCATILAMVGFALGGQRTPSALTACLIVACTPAYCAEAAIGQYSSFVCASFAIGYLLFSKKLDFWAGFTLLATMLKPHDVAIPAILLAYRVATERRWSVLVGALTALVISVVALEVIRPGIHSLWIYREVWPAHVFGSTLPSAIRSTILSTLGFTPWWPLIVGPLLGIACLYGAIQRFGLSSRDHSTMMLAIGLNTIFSPYGFLFDQCILIVALAYYFSILTQESPRTANKVLIIFTVSVWTALYSVLNSWTFAGRSFWFVFSGCTVAAIFSTEAWLHRKKTT